MEKILLAGREFHVVLTRKAMKHTYLRVKGNTIYVSSNPYTTETQIVQMIQKNQSRILERSLAKPSFYDTDAVHVSFFGQSYSLIKKEAPHSGYSFIKQELIVSYKKESDIVLVLKQIATDKVVHEALVYLEMHKQELSKYLNISGLLIKAQPMKSQFGSCHTLKKVIKLNSSLAFFDPIYLHAILLHELVHLKIKGHQDNFYQLLETLSPNYKQIRADLKELFLNYEV
ncbi:MAG: M48 family metallopeptidase [Candidatus Izemoplasmatales bacterium]